MPVAPQFNEEPLAEADVVLVSMPFGPLLTPSIGLGLLAAHLQRERIPTQTLYLTTAFAKQISADVYTALAQGQPGNHFLLGEWLFRDALFEADSAESNDAFLSLLKPAVVTTRRAAKGRWSDFTVFVDEILSVRQQANQFIAVAAERILQYSPRIVGFTSVFQQHVSSLAIAAEIKRRDPRVTTVFGGANCESVMGVETVKQFPQVDYVVSGEGDVAFPELVRGLLEGERPEIAGVFHRAYSQSQLTTTMVRDLDSLPFPDYAPYFAQLQECDLGLEPQASRLLFETSRGCWWGEKQHCTFCGLNGTTMEFRSKSARRAYDELQWMASRYSGHAVSVVDNILDMKYFRDFVPLLADSQLEVELFYEVKANLKKEQVRLLKQANVNMIQPGIESLHDSVLSLMRKGVSALQNIQLLKWCATFAISPHWNLIWGFPKEDPDAYAEMTTLIPLLRHLPAPKSTSAIRLDRFSPNFNDAARLGISDIRPFPVYDFIYPLEARAKANLAYYFTFQYASGQDPDAYTRCFLDAIHQWQTANDTYHFFYMSAGENLILWDFRDLGDGPLIVLTPLQKDIYLFCDTAQTIDAICAGLGDAHGIGEQEVRAELQRMLKRKLMLQGGNRYLSLALEWDEDTTPVQALVAMQKYIESNKAAASTAEESVLDLSPFGLA